MRSPLSAGERILGGIAPFGVALAAAVPEGLFLPALFGALFGYLWFPAPGSAMEYAAAILLLYLGLTFAGAAVISAAEGLPLGACLYETASAAGTVGLTLGLTPQLGTLSQGILILLMFFGRVGGLTLIYAAFSGHDLTYARYPKEMITVG